MEAGVIMNGVRSVFAVLDGFIYFLISVIYDLIKDLASIQLFSGGDYANVSQKIYGIMGLFMLFKVSFSLLTYIVDPDSFSDKSKGASTIAKNIIIVLILIILSPFAFDEMARAQKIILDENIIERFVFGKGTGEEKLDGTFQMNEMCGDKFAKAASDGDFVALTVFSAFYKPNGEGFTEIEDLYCPGDDEEVTVNKTYLISDLYNANGNWDAGNEDIYFIDYNWFWSTIAGGAVVFLFLNICIEIAKRTVKLGFLQLIAPIPIISYIDPKSGKDGMFKRWLKQLGSTWASLFIRLLAIYFAVHVISLIGKNLTEMSLWGEIFLVFGCLMFAKELPKLLENLIPGLNLAGSFTLNPLKNIRENMLGGKYVAGAISGTAGAAASILPGGAANFWGARVQNRNVKKQLADEGLTAGTAEYKKRFKELHGNTFAGYVGSVAAGAFSSGFRSFWAGVNGKGGMIKSANAGITAASQARNQRDAGYNLRSKMYDIATDVAKIKDNYGTTDVLKGQIKEYQRQLSNTQRDEMTYSQLFRDRINAIESNKSGLTEGLMKVFDNAFDKAANKYVDKSYNDYRDIAGKEAWMSYMHQTAADWDALTDVEKNRDMSMLAHLNLVANETEFNTVNSVYKQFNAKDLEGKALERKIKSTEENLRKKSTKGQ